ncbi:hypothetical protein BOX15_Mlig031851g1, partial [Macrostomum lignano]
KKNIRTLSSLAKRQDRTMFRVVLLSCLVAFAYAQCGCSPSMISDENGLPKADPETGLYEGDMRLTSNNFLELLGLRNTVRNLWTTKIVPYTVVSGNPSAVDSALASLQSRLSNCIRFKRRSGESDYIEVFSGSGCWSYVGRTGGKQQMSLQSNGCYSVGTIQHEFIHALGLFHEQSRSDRDSFVTVHWGNINNKQCHNFYKQGSLPSGFPAYDYVSVMHYGTTAFTCNGSKTLTTRSGGNVGGSSLTNLDVAKIRALYRC